jgi:hypothetical protein
MSQAPDVTDPTRILSIPEDPRVGRFDNDPAVVVMHWTPDLWGPQPSSVDDDLLGYSKEAVAEHLHKYTTWLNELQRHLAAARYVIVRHWCPNAETTWDVGSISRFKGDMNQHIEFQGMFTFLPSLKTADCGHSRCRQAGRAIPSYGRAAGRGGISRHHPLPQIHPIRHR